MIYARGQRIAIFRDGKFFDVGTFSGVDDLGFTWLSNRLNRGIRLVIDERTWVNESCHTIPVPDGDEHNAYEIEVPYEKVLDEVLMYLPCAELKPNYQTPNRQRRVLVYTAQIMEAFAQKPEAIERRLGHTFSRLQACHYWGYSCVFLVWKERSALWEPELHTSIHTTS